MCTVPVHGRLAVTFYRCVRRTQQVFVGSVSQFSVRRNISVRRVRRVRDSRMNLNLVWRIVLFSLSLNTFLSGEDFEGYRVLREGLG